LQGKISSDGCLKKEQMVVSAIASTPQKDVDLHQVLWSRSRLGERQKGQGITGADHFWFGHTPLRHRVDIGNLHYIDTGAVFGGELTLVQLQ
ncbi:TPA: hypothetical protein ACIDP8_004397, partial [Shigella sonnei]